MCNQCEENLERLLVDRLTSNEIYPPVFAAWHENKNMKKVFLL
jgi:hypothetical protein